MLAKHDVMSSRLIITSFNLAPSCQSGDGHGGPPPSRQVGRQAMTAARGEAGSGKAERERESEELL
jgi:hypothetical protein